LSDKLQGGTRSSASDGKRYPPGLNTVARLSLSDEQDRIAALLDAAIGCTPTLRAEVCVVGVAGE